MNTLNSVTYRTFPNMAQNNPLKSSELTPIKPNKKCSVERTKNVRFIERYSIDNQFVKKSNVRRCSPQNDPKKAISSAGRPISGPFEKVFTEHV